MNTVDFFAMSFSMACGIGVIGGAILAIAAHLLGKSGAGRRGFSVTFGRTVVDDDNS